MTRTRWITRDNLTEPQRVAACEAHMFLAAAAQRATYAGDIPFARMYAASARAMLKAFGQRWLTPQSKGSRDMLNIATFGFPL